MLGQVRAKNPISLSTRRNGDRLFEALGIIEVTRDALASNLTTFDEQSAIDTLKTAYRIVDDFAAALEKSKSAPSLNASGRRG